MITRSLLIFSLLAMTGCAIEDSRIADRARHELVGMQMVDLEACLGVPDQHASFGNTDILTWYATSSSNISYGIPFIGGVTGSNGGNCHATARLENGRVIELRYTGEKNATGAASAYCAPIVRSCMAQPERPRAGATAAETGRP
jgi:hypothetical protein